MKQASSFNSIFPFFSDELDSVFENKINKFLSSLVYDDNENHFNNFKERVKLEFPKLLNTKTIIIGGTNGKGEVSYILSYLLSQKYQIATWSSPHLLSIRERICISGKFIKYVDIFQLLKKNAHLSKSFNYYEFLFYNFLSYVNKLELDFLVLEVGVGGRLDAVNSLNPIISILTNISRDHQALLGKTYKKITLEKIKIARENNLFITCTKLKFVNQIIYKLKKDTYNLHEKNIVISNDDYSIKNKITALVAHHSLFSQKKLSRKHLLDESTRLNKVSFWGRRNYFKLNNKTIYILGAHNLDGVRNTTKYIKDNKLYFDKCLFGFSKKPLKELKKMSYSLLKLNCNINKYLYCEFSCFKALNLSEINQFLPKDCEISNEWNNEILSNNPLSKPEKILITGSYYFIGEVLSLIFSKSSIS